MPTNRLHIFHHNNIWIETMVDRPSSSSGNLFPVLKHSTILQIMEEVNVPLTESELTEPGRCKERIREVFVQLVSCSIPARYIVPEVYFLVVSIDGKRRRRCGAVRRLYWRRSCIIFFAAFFRLSFLSALLKPRSSPLFFSSGRV